MKNKLLIWILCMILLISCAVAFDLITGHSVHSGSFDVEEFAPVINAGNYTGDAGDLVQINYTVYDPNGDNVTVNFTSPFNAAGYWNSTTEDTGIRQVNITTSDGNLESNVTVYVKLSPYCGDGRCDSSDGESCANCQDDCGICPNTGGNTGGGGGSSSRIRELQEEIVRLTNITDRLDDFKPESKELFFEMQEDEFRAEKINIKNNMDISLFLRADSFGEIADSIVFDSRYLTISPNSEKKLDIMVLANKNPGTYRGELLFVSSTNNQTIPITLKIIKRLARPEIETLDLDADMISQNVNPGEKLKFKLNLRKAPLITNETEEVILSFLVMDLSTDTIGKITGLAVSDLREFSREKQDVVFMEDKVYLKDVISYPVEIEMPSGIATGEYILYINAKFKGKEIPLFTKFNVDVPWYNVKFMNISKGLWVLLGLIVAILWSMFIISRVDLSSKGICPVKVKSSKIPKKSTDSAYLGKLVHKNKKAYINFNDLKTHTLISGTTGCGKTMSAQVMVEEALQKDIPVIVFDPTKQWTGFLRECKSRGMLKKYKRFNMKKNDARCFGGKVYQIKHPRKKLKLDELRKDKLNIILLDKLNSRSLNTFIANTIKNIYKSDLDEHRKLNTLIIFDEVHRLLPKYGGSKKGINALEKAVREFRKWGIGTVLISQVTEDLVGPIEANISTQIQMKTNDKKDLARIKDKYGEKFLRSVVKAPTGTALLSNSSYNEGQPYFIEFRPVMHRTKGLNKKELEKYLKYSRKIKGIRNKIEKLGSKRKNRDLQIELELAEKQIKLGKFDIAKVYVKNLKKKLRKRKRKSKK